MKVIHYNTFAHGGSAVLMLRLHAALRSMKHDSRIRYRKGSLLMPDALQVEYCRGWWDRQRERVQHRLENWILKPNAPSTFGRSFLHKSTHPLIEDRNADVIHLHWISQWLDLASFLRGFPLNTPIIWTIHDMSPLAGGCFTDFGCQQVETGCLRCPLMKSFYGRHLAAGEWKRRNLVLQGRPLFVVGNSRFTTQMAKRSKLFHCARKVMTIHPGLDLRDFTCHSKADAKKLLGISEGSLVLGFGAAALTDENKGLSRFFEIVRRVAAKAAPVEVLIFGDGLAGAEIPGVRIHSLGRLSSSRLQSVAYSAMDVFVVASKMETFGQVATEAQASGTPVWAFDVGGLADAIDSEKTGKLIPYGQYDQSADSILDAFKRGKLAEMGRKGREWVGQKFDAADMASQYLELYREAVSVVQNDC